MSHLPERKPIDTRYTQERELSWLRFDERVLQEATDEDVPLYERLKFVSIFSSNLDEFFMIRVGSILDMSLVKETHLDRRSGLTPEQQLRAIFQAVGPLYKQRDKVFSQLETRLRACNICNLTLDQLDNKEQKQVERYFRDYILPILSPLVIDARHPFPHLPNKSLNVAISLKQGGERLFGLVPVPKSLPPFFQLNERGLRYILTEHIIQEFAYLVFDQYQVESKAILSVTRNADISPDDEEHDINEDFLQHMRKILKKRARLAPVRLEVQGSLPDSLLTVLCQRLSIGSDQVFRTTAPIDMGYVFALEERLPPESAQALRFQPFTPKFPAGLIPGEKMIPQILRRDALLFYPYHDMKPFLQLIKEAAYDPAVVSIKITIYRLASKTKLIESLAAAAENGKDVTVLMELKARFDEQNNIAWAERLEEAGCTLLYGFQGVKVHSKLCLITRRDKGHIQYITQVGTGNYNEKTAKLYTDFSLMTSNPVIGADAAAFFQNLSTSNLAGAYQQLLVAPNGMKPRLLDLIDGEISKAKLGRPARIFIKCNSITDRELIDKLAEASQAGVHILLNIRGICCIRPKVEGFTDNIRVFSIVGRFLEHPRLFAFGADADCRIYIGSADFMTRNVAHRVEIACPILDESIRGQLKHYIDVLCADNEKARFMDNQGHYHPVPNQGKPPLDAQATFMAEATQQEPVVGATPPAPVKKPGFFARLFGRRK